MNFSQIYYLYNSLEIFTKDKIIKYLMFNKFPLVQIELIL